MFMNRPTYQPTNNNERESALTQNILEYAKDGTQKFEVQKNEKSLPLNSKSVEEKFAIEADPNTHPEGDWSNIPFHEHNNGADQPFVEFKYLAGFIQTLPGYGPPTHIPKNMFDQIVLILNVMTPELWIYDITNKTWRKFT